jgi:predicted metal-binding membrane protein
MLASAGRRATSSADSAVILVLALVGLAWLIALIGEVTGTSALLHHHALISRSGPPLWLATVMFLVAWQVMVAGMMLPASLPAFRLTDRDGILGFLLAYTVVWTGFGFVAFMGDVGIHALVHATPWLEERSWLVTAGLLATAGSFQFAPLKHRALDACRHPSRPSSAPLDDRPHRGGFAQGFRHAIDCLASSWALMLVMFAAGFGSLAWMTILAAVMAYEAIWRHGHRFASAFGVVLLALAGMTAASAA